VLATSISLSGSNMLAATVLRSPDGGYLFGLAELYLLAAVLFRDGLGGALADLVAAGDMTAGDASYVAGLVARDNARRVYRL